MSEKNTNRIIAAVVLVILVVAYFYVSQYLVVSYFDTGPMLADSFPYLGGVLLSSVVFFLMSYSAIVDIVSGDPHKYPKY